MKNYRKLSIVGHNVYEELRTILEEEQPDSYQVLEVKNIGTGIVNQFQELIVMFCEEKSDEV